MYKKYLFLLIIVLTIGFLVPVEADNNLWFLSSGSVRPNVSTWKLLVPQLGGSGTSCVQVDNNGLFTVTGSSCGGSFTGLAMHEGSNTAVHITDLQFSPSSFNFSNTASTSLLTLDYTNGPASRSLSQTWTGLPTFSVGASVSSNFELTSGYASLSNTMWVSPPGYSGNVGIGTSAPNVKLQIQNTTTGLSTVGGARVLTIDGVGALNNLTEVGIGSLAGVPSANSPALIGYKSMNAGGFTYGDLYFATRNVTTNTAASVRMTIQSDGKIGIGTTAPATKFEVQGGASASYLLADGVLQVANSGATVSYSRFGTGATTHANWISTAGDLFLSNDLEGRGSISFAGTASFSNTMWVSAAGNGNVGIGTTTPSQKLSVVQPSGVVTRSSVESGTTYISYGADSTNGPFYSWNSTQAMRFATSTNTSGAGFTEKMRIGVSGASLSTNFEATGYASISGGLHLYNIPADAAGDTYLCLDATGIVRTGGTCTASTRLVKEDIQKLLPNDWVEKLNAVTFKYKDSFYGGKKDIGLIAEEVYKISPILTVLAGEDNPKIGYKKGDPIAINYNAITALLVQQTQEDHQGIQDLKDRLNKLEKTNSNTTQENQVWVFVAVFISIIATVIALFK